MKHFSYLARASSKTLWSMISQPNEFAQRSWSAEFTRRLGRGLLDMGVNETDDWLRAKQALLSSKGPALLKVDCHKRVYRGVECLEVSPKASGLSKRTIVYFHGGGYVVGSTNTYRYTMAKIALACSANVIGVDYRLAPEHTLGQIHQDCMAVVDHLKQSSSLVLMGDSAGAALCLEVACRLKEAGALDALAGLVLISPWVAPEKPELLSAENQSGDLVSEAILSRWYASISGALEYPGQASYDLRDFAGFPSTYVQVAGNEVFLGQVNMLVKRMKEQGVSVGCDLYEDQFHVFQTLAPLVPEADAAIAKIAQNFHSF